MGEKMKIIKGDTLLEATPELVAHMFCEMSADEQAAFFNEVSELATKWDPFGWPMQLQYLADDETLTLGGRRVMQGIGDYSHWGLVPKVP